MARTLPIKSSSGVPTDRQGRIDAVEIQRNRMTDRALGSVLSFGSHTCTIDRLFGVGFAQWIVCELDERGAPHYGPALLFFSTGLGRRVREYPPNWRDLSDEELYAVSWNR